MKQEDRDFLDPVFKEVMAFNFAQLALPVETQVEISRLPRTMDALVVLEHPPNVRKFVSKQFSIIFRSTIKLNSKGKTIHSHGMGITSFEGEATFILEKRISPRL